MSTPTLPLQDGREGNVLPFCMKIILPSFLRHQLGFWTRPLFSTGPFCYFYGWDDLGVSQKNWWFNRPLNFMLCCFYWITSILYSQMFLWSWCLTKGLRFLPRPPLMLDLNTHAFHQSPDEGNELSSHQIASMQCIISHYITGAWVKITRWC